MRLLGTVVDRVAADGVSGRVYVVGGAAMSLRYYPDGVERHPTEDIDAVFTPVEPIIAAVEEVAREERLALDWFNNKMRGFLPPLVELDGEVLFARGGVKVVVAPAELLLAMKARACRLGRDDEDIAVLIRHLGIVSIDEVDALVERMWLGEVEIPPARRAVVAATFGAYELTRSTPAVTLPPVGS